MTLESYYLLVRLTLVYISVGFLPTNIADSVQPLEDQFYGKKGIANANKDAIDRNEDVPGVRMEDVSEYSSSFLSDTKTMPSYIVGGKTYHFELGEPSADDEVMNAARKRIGESPEVVQKAKKELTALLENDSELNVPLENDAWLIRFLRLKNYNVRQTYEHIKAYYKSRKKSRFLYDNVVPSELLETAEARILTLLPNRDQLGRRVLIFKIANWKPAEHPLLDVWRLSAILAEMGAYEPATQIAGCEIIYEMNGLNWQRTRQFNPTIAARLISWLTSLPIRVAGIHVVNQPPIFGSLFKFFRPFLTKELKNKLFFHGNNMKSLHQHISPSSLPSTYGGTYNEPDFSIDQWYAYLKSVDKEIAKIDTYGMKSKN